MAEKEARSSGYFDRFALIVGEQVSKTWFFVACAASIVLWAICGPIFGFSSTWQLVVNTGTTIVTFLLVALLQNTQDRSTKALQHKLDALTKGLAYVLEDTAGEDRESKDYIAELREMAGVEMEEGA